MAYFDLPWCVCEWTCLSLSTNKVLLHSKYQQLTTAELDVVVLVDAPAKMPQAPVRGCPSENASGSPLPVLLPPPFLTLTVGCGGYLGVASHGDRLSKVRLIH